MNEATTGGNSPNRDPRILPFTSQNEPAGTSGVADPLGRMAGGIAHDFNNLLTVILSYSDILLMGSEAAGSEDRELIGEIRRAAERGARVTHRLLAFSRRNESQAREVSQGEVMQGLSKEVLKARPEGIELVLQPGTGQGLIWADPAQLVEALRCLVRNAEQSMPEGGRILVRCRDTDLPKAVEGALGTIPAGTYAVFSVEDQGVGIEREMLPRLCQPFFTTRGSGRGTGLGLTTAMAMVRTSDGYLHMGSEPGRGSLFEVYLPHMETSSEDGEEAGATLVLVEEDSLLRQARGAELRAAGYRVLVAEHMAEAGQILDNNRETALLICDFRDVSTARLLAPSGTQEIPLLLLGGTFQPAELQPGEAFLERPFQSQELLDQVQRSLTPGEAPED